MKRYLLMSAFVLLSVCMEAQDEVKVYLDANLNQVDKEKDAQVIRTAKVINDRYIIEDQNRKGATIFYGEFSSIDPLIEDGLSKHYRYGRLYATGYYKKGRLTGKWVYIDGKSTDTVDYAPVEKYLGSVGQSCSEISIEDTGKLFTDEIAQIKEDIRHFFTQQVHIPARSRDAVDYVQCALSFDVDTNGLIRCPEISNCQNIDIIYEVLRVALLYQGENKAPLRITIPDLLEDFEPVFVFVEEQASFQGGSLNSFRDWVQKNLKYPEEALTKGVQGRITVQFAVNSKGYVRDVKILRGVEASLDNEACRVIMSSPRWMAAKNAGAFVRQQFVMPVIFLIEDKREENH